MFRATYKNTIKNMLRSPTFWMMLAFLAGLCVYAAFRVSYGMLLMDTNETITDLDPRWVYSFDKYVQNVRNCIDARVCLFAMPLFTVSTVAIVLKRDFTDNFYEIEKASGARSGCYLTSRLAALLTVNFIVVLFAVFLNFHMFTALRSLPKDMTLWTYIADSTVRLICLSVVVAFPCVIFYVGLAFGIGNLFRSSIASAITSVAYIVAYFVVCLVFRFKLMFEYGMDLFAWLPALPLKVSDYFKYYGTDRFEDYVKEMSLADVVLALGIIFASFAVFYVISYLCQRKRTA